MTKIESGLSFNPDGSPYNLGIDLNIGSPIDTPYGGKSIDFGASMELPSFFSDDSFQLNLGAGFEKEIQEDSFENAWSIYFQPELVHGFRKGFWIKAGPQIVFCKGAGSEEDEGVTEDYSYNIIMAGVAASLRYDWLRLKARTSYMHFIDNPLYSRIKLMLGESATLDLEDVPLLGELPFLESLSITESADLRYDIRKNGDGRFEAFDERNRLNFSASLEMSYAPTDWLTLSAGETFNATLEKGEETHAFSTFVKAAGEIEGWGEVSVGLFAGTNPPFVREGWGG